MTAVTHQPAQPANRLAPVRRVYVYVVAFVSLVAALLGATDLITTLSQIWLGSAGQIAAGGGVYGRSVAASGGLLLVATPLFLIHWGLAQARRADEDERSSVLRKLFLYAASAWSLSNFLLAIYALVEGVALLAFGQPARQSQMLPALWLAWLLTAAMNGALVLYWYAVLQADGDYGVEHTGGRIVRQLFLLVFGLVGLALLIWGGATLIQAVLRIVLDQVYPGGYASGWSLTIASALAQLLVGGWLAWTNRAQWRQVVAGHASEGQAAVRRLYLYIGVVLGAIATLTPAALVLRELLLAAFGDTLGPPAELLGKLVDPIAFVPVGIAVWLVHWNVLRREANAFGESREGATVRRIYFYLMAATGLALLWVGAVELLHALIDAWLDAGTVGGIWHQPLANGLALIAVGAPIWALHWRSVQQVARRSDAAGEAERDALMRKIYLYGVALAGALIILFQLAQVVYRVLLVLMGDPTAAVFSNETARMLADCAVAGALWVVHVLAIRGDGQFEKQQPATVSAETLAVTPAAVPADASPAARRRLLEARVAQLEQELAAARAELEQVTQPATGVQAGDSPPL